MVEVFELVSVWLVSSWPFMPEAENTRPFIHWSSSLDSSISMSFSPSQPTPSLGYRTTDIYWTYGPTSLQWAKPAKLKSAMVGGGEVRASPPQQPHTNTLGWGFGPAGAAIGDLNPQ
jgi:hypothetical protein